MFPGSGAAAGSVSAVLFRPGEFVAAGLEETICPADRVKAGVMIEKELERGEALFAEGRIEEARTCFLSILETVPEQARALNNLGVVRLTQGETREAEAYWRRAILARDTYTDAYLNLAHALTREGRLEEAAELLESARAGAPNDVNVINRLAGIYSELGRPEEAWQLLDGSRVRNRLKEFIDSVWLSVDYWDRERELDRRACLEGLAAGLLSTIDGLREPGIHYRLVAGEGDEDEPTILEWLHEAFWYKKRASMGQGPTGRGEVLPLGGNHPDWKAFRMQLLEELSSEGGCLGDLTQTRKVMRSLPRLHKYDVEATVRKIQKEIGPCDCHLRRWQGD